MNKVFRRLEKKYFLTEEQFKVLLDKCSKHLEEDKYFESAITNIYFDNFNDDLAITSLEKPIYKEKFRLRGYGLPTKEDIVFLEVKRKYKGVVGKRRIAIKLKDAEDFIATKHFKEKTQIHKEIEYAFNYYNLVPKIYIAYDRLSYYEKDNPGFRITFDSNLRKRDYDLHLDSGDYGIKVLDGTIIMEVKTLNSIPRWFVHILNEMKIYPTSYSKYGELYKMKEKKMFNSIINGQILSITTTIICLIAALLFGFIISLVHMKTVRTNKNFVITIILLPLLVSVIMMMVNGNLGTSVAVLGAFSLIRFRSLPGNSREITSIFLAMAIGLSIGMGHIVFAGLITLFTSLVLIVLSNLKLLNDESSNRVLRIIVPEDLDYDQVFDDILKKHTKKYELDQVKTVNMGSLFELKYSIKIDSKKMKDLINDIRVRNGNMKITISDQISEYNL